VLPVFAHRLKVAADTIPLHASRSATRKPLSRAPHFDSFDINVYIAVSSVAA
jgi:hypothetical protein